MHWERAINTAHVPLISANDKLQSERSGGTRRMMADKTIHKLVAVCEVTSFVQRCMEAAGAPAPHAATVAEVLIAADVRGHYSHGVNRLGKCIFCLHF